MMYPPSRKTEAYRWAMSWATLACALAWGVVELLALQRARWQLWRERLHTPAHH